MATIRVNLLNWHWPVFTHISIMLENISKSPTEYMLMERWNHEFPMLWETNHSHLWKMNEASYKYTFEIEADPEEIANEWRTFKHNTPNMINNNCGDGAQWFLQRFANIPAPSCFSAPLTLNHFALGIFLPSFCPVGITLPGRVVDNAKFHLKTREDADILPYQYSTLLLKIGIAATLLASATSIIGLIAATTYLSSSILAISAWTVAGTLSTVGLFKSVNTLASVNLASELNNLIEKPSPS